MPRLRLSDADRERLGAPEFLAIDIGSITNREAIALQQAGWPTPKQWRNALRSDPVKDESGETVDYLVDFRAWTYFLWLALTRAGVVSDPETLEFDLEHMGYLPDEAPPPPPPAVEPGKSVRSKTSPKKSSTSGGTSRAKSRSTPSRSSSTSE